MRTVDPSPGSADGKGECAACDVQERLLILADACQAMLAGAGADPVTAVLRLSERLLAADAYAVWRRDAETGDWSVVADVALSAAFPRRIPAAAVRSLPPEHRSLPAEPIAVPDVRTSPLLRERQEAYRKEGIRSLLAVPFGDDDGMHGTVVFYYHEPHRFSATEVRLGAALANLAATALRGADLQREQERMRREAERGRQRLAFLAEAGTVLASSLEYETTLTHVARLVVPHLADWCVIHLKEPDGTVRQVAVVHRDPERVIQAQALNERYPHDPGAPRGVANVLRTGQSELYPEISDALLVAAARDPEHLTILRDLGISSGMIVPLAIRDRILGTISFIAAESGAHYGPEDLTLAESLAHRAAAAIESARLYREAESALAGLRAADRRKDEFLAMLGHELRNPMGAIRSAAQVVNRIGSGDARLDRAVAIIQRQCRQLASLVDDLLDVSRIRRGQLRVTRERLDLGDLVCAVARELSGGVEKARLHASAPQEPLWIDGDAARLRQVLENLIDNALKFTPPDGEVVLTLERVGGWAELTVRDTGIGIPAEMLPELFDPFAQVAEIRSRSLGGLGLGLPLVQGIVALHGGEIHAESEGRDRGATFRVRLPLAP